MRLKSLIYLVAGILLTASLIPAFMSVSDIDASAQISVQPTSTSTATSSAPTSTDTPVPPTPTSTSTSTPIPPTPTSTSTSTSTPIPPTPTSTSTSTSTPIPPTPTPTSTSTPTPIPPTPTPTDTPIPIPPPPALSAITVEPLDGLAAVGATLGFTVVYTDPPPPPDYTTWLWGDGNTTACAPGSADCEFIPGSGTQGTLVASHVYSEPGVYTVQAKVEDSYGQSDISTYEYVVVYDLSGGFVSGGGWIDSLPNAYAPDPSLTGKATFGFVSRYKRGSSRPTGNTQFQFKVADLKFFSDTYDWLVVNQNGTNAQFKGSGTINGAVAPTLEDYRFMIWATDGSASDTADTFRIKIWYDDTHPTTGEEIEMVVYDNGEDQAIGGGNITVHKPSKKK